MGKIIDMNPEVILWDICIDPERTHDYISVCKMDRHVIILISTSTFDQVEELKNKSLALKNQTPPEGKKVLSL